MESQQSGKGGTEGGEGERENARKGVLSCCQMDSRWCDFLRICVLSLPILYWTRVQVQYTVSLYLLDESMRVTKLSNLNREDSDTLPSIGILSSVLRSQGQH